MLNIVVALKCEAKTIIQHYGLKHVPGKHPFPVYEKDGIALTISGPGKVAAAAATAVIYTMFGESSNIGWLNLGIAGHKSRSLGQGVLANKITDKASNRNWYPPIVFTPPCESENLITVDQVENQYQKNAVYEMEASGFYETASRFSTAELVHSYKVISDNTDYSTKNITEESVKQLIKTNLEEIDAIFQEINYLSASLQSIERLPQSYEKISERWHFSVYQKGELRRLLKRWELIEGETQKNEIPLVQRLKKCKNGKAVLFFLEKSVTQQ